MSNKDAFEESFQFYSVTVPTKFPSTGARDDLAASHQPSSPNSYLRLGDTPTAADLNQQTEPGQEQLARSVRMACVELWRFVLSPSLAIVCGCRA